MNIFFYEGYQDAFDDLLKEDAFLEGYYDALMEESSPMEDYAKKYAKRAGATSAISGAVSVGLAANNIRLSKKIQKLESKQNLSDAEKALLLKLKKQRTLSRAGTAAALGTSMIAHKSEKDINNGIEMINKYRI